MGENVWPSDVMVHLARRLHAEMQRLDPGPEDRPWDDLREWDRQFFFHCVEAVVDEARNFDIGPFAKTT